MNTAGFQKLVAIAVLLCSSCSREASRDGSDSLSIPLEAQAAFDEIVASGYYHKPTYQDCIVQSTNFSDSKAYYSFSPYYPFVLSPRRQTDQLVMQLYEHLPQKVKNKWAFVIADRLVQNPEKYLEYLQKRENVYIIGAINGTSSVRSCMVSHTKILDLTYKFLRKLRFSPNQISVMYGKGDSPTSQAIQLRIDEETSLNARLAQAERPLSKLQAPKVRVTWGADELVHLAFTNALIKETGGDQPTAEVIISDSNRKMHYDGNATIHDIAREKLSAVGIGYRSQGSAASFKLIIHSAVSGSNTWSPSEGDSNAAYVDRRMEYNGAADYEWAPLKNCNNLAYSAWGTAGNAVGSAIATAVIVKNSDERKKLFLEAVAHDAVYIGYKMRNEMRINIPIYRYDSEYYVSSSEMQNALLKASGVVQNVMDKVFQGTTCLAGKRIGLSTQLNRFFEANTEVK